MDDEMVHKLSKFNLRDKEEEGIVLEMKVISWCKEEGKKSLLGKIWDSKVANYTSLKQTFSQLWRQSGDLKVVELGLSVHFYKERRQ